MRLVRFMLIGGAMAVVLCGMFMTPEDAPVERLLENMSAFVRKNPKDADGYYRLGRIHYLAFATMRTTLPYFPDRDGGVTAANGYDEIQMLGRSVMRPVEPGAISQSARAAHYLDAYRMLTKAIALDPKNGLYELGLASLVEDGGTEYAGPEWREHAIGHYLAAYQFSIGEDEATANWIEPLVAYEAGMAYARLVRERGARDAFEAATVQAIPGRIEKLKPHRLLTPVVFSLRSGAKLEDLLAPNTRVSFDLGGAGLPRPYSWLQPETALLVWDRQHTGRITSGRQLFGNVTWWMFWDNGYQALAALDDNQDGWTSGAELSGLALWFDRNQNGVSDPGEVIPIEQAGVLGLAVQPDDHAGSVLIRRAGVRLSDGRVLPTWDWIATEIPAPPAYSSRKVVTGSTRAALLAGQKPASNPADRSSTVTAAKE